MAALHLLRVGDSPEVVHWYYKVNDKALNSVRYMELWLPVVKK